MLLSAGRSRRPSHDVSALIEIDAYGFRLATITHSTWSNLITFVNHEGVERQIDDATGFVMELVEAIRKGNGKKPQANHRHDFDTDGLKATNLQPVMGGEGRPQQVGGQFLGADD